MNTQLSQIDSPPQYSLIAAIRAAVAGTFTKLPSIEYHEHKALTEEFGPAPGNCIRIPKQALVRDLSVATASAGGYLTSALVGGYVDSIRRLSVGLSLGVRTETLPVPSGPFLVPVGGSVDPTATWLATETSQAAESTPTFGQAAATPKLLALNVEVSRQLLLQSNADAITRYRLAVAAAKALDSALVAGSGASGEPLGIVNTAGIGGVTGTSLGYPGIVEFQQDVADAEGVEDVAALGFATTPTVAGLLMQRHKVASTASQLWEGNLSAGNICGRPAFASKSMPAGTMLYADWTGVTIFEWDGVAIEVNPYANFAAGIVAIRLLLPVDILVTRPKAFSLASSIT